LTTQQLLIESHEVGKANGLAASSMTDFVVPAIQEQRPNTSYCSTSNAKLYKESRRRTAITNASAAGPGNLLHEVALATIVSCSLTTSTILQGLPHKGQPTSLAADVRCDILDMHSANVSSSSAT
jgi:hypothetical protein